MNDEAGAAADPEWREREKGRMTSIRAALEAHVRAVERDLKSEQPNPIDTIREALEGMRLAGDAWFATNDQDAHGDVTSYLAQALAALTQVEQRNGWDEANQQRNRAVAVEQRANEALRLQIEARAQANDLADALREIAELPGANRGGIYEIPVRIARVALDRHTKEVTP